MKHNLIERSPDTLVAKPSWHRATLAALTSALLLGLGTAPALAAAPQSPQKVLGWIGQSNMVGHCDLSTLTMVAMPDDSMLRSAISYYQVNLDGTSDRDGRVSPMMFHGWPAPAACPHGFAYQPNLLVDTSGSHAGSFGPDLAASLLVSAWTGEHIVNCKLAVSGAFLTQTDSPPAISFPLEQVGSYLWSGAFSTYDLDLPWLGENNCYHALDLFGGTVAGAGATSPTELFLRDPSASWSADMWAGDWVFANGLTAKVLHNTADTLTVSHWCTATSPAPITGSPYSIQSLSMRPASIAKSWLHGYCATTKQLLAAAGKDMDLRCVGIQIGESDSLRHSTASLVETKMLQLIAWIRKGLVQGGMTTVQEHEVGIVLGLIRESAPWTHAASVNQAYRNIAAADPFVRVSEVTGIPVGGAAPSPSSPDFDPLHYTADGQIINGLRFAVEMLNLLTAQ